MRVLLAAITLVTAVVTFSDPMQADGAQSSQTESDALRRGTPRSSLQGYLEAVDAGNYERAAAYLDLRNLHGTVTQYRPDQIARGLAIVLQRSLWIDIDALSDDPTGHQGDGLPDYRDLVGTIETREGSVPVWMQRVPGDYEGLIWKVSNATLALLPRLYEEYRYNTYVEWLYRGLPQVSIAGVELFKWAAALSATAAAVPVMLLIASGLSWLGRRRSEELHAHVRRFPFGPFTVLVLLLVFSMTLHNLGLGVAAQAIAEAQTLVIFAALWLIWAGIEFGRAAYAEYLINRNRGSSIPLLRPLATALKITFVLSGILVWLDNLGYEITALLTGLGIGGVAVALVLQKPLEDIFGAVSLYTQQPIGVGDFGRFGSYSGTIVEISLRSTRIRTLDNTLVSVPNMRLASEPIENFSARSKILYKPELYLRRDTAAEQIDEVLNAIRRLLEADDRVLEDGARVRFTRRFPD